MKEIVEVVAKWRGMDRVELLLWAHLRLDRIENELGLNNRMPNLEEIAYKLKSEATEIETDTYQSILSVLKEYFTKFCITSHSSFRHLFNRFLAPNQCDCQNQTPNECKNKTDNVQPITYIYTHIRRILKWSKHHVNPNRTEPAGCVPFGIGI